MPGEHGDRPTFIDIDGTLTRSPHVPFGEVIPDRVAEVQRLLANGLQIVLWSGGGTAYAKAFAEQNGLSAAICIGKPEIAVDDNPEIRPNMKDRVIHPDLFFGC